MSEYTAALEGWARALDSEKLSLYLTLESFTDSEYDALVMEDLRRIRCQEGRAEVER